jgi:heme/copper-type cytochrome/quinol oxidase subunit 2
MPEKPNQHNPVDVIYLEADSEITEAIDKLKSARGREVRIAVPARSTMLQSAVNLKLLKKTAQKSGKKLVLISSDRATLSLAAGLGLLVAKNVKAEALLPSSAVAPPRSSHEPVVIDQAREEAGQSRGSSSSSSSSRSSSKSSSNNDSNNNYIDLSEDSQSDSEIQKANAGHSKKSKQSPKIPNFMGLNKKISIIVAVFTAFIMLVLAYVFLPTAKVTLLAKAQKTPVNVEFTLESTVKESDFSQGLVAANQLTVTKDLSAQYTATGKKDVGTKATGSVKISNATSSNPVSLPAGATLTASGKTFSLNQAVTVPGATVSGGIVPGTINTQITATQNGDSYNLSGATFSVSSGGPLLTATGSTSDGTTKIAVVVTQADIDKAQKEMIDSASQNAKQDVESKAGSDERFFPETFTSTVSGLTTSAPVDSESSGGTVSAKVKYSELSANNTDLDKLFTEQIKTQIPGSNQLYQSGWKDAKYSAKPSSSEKAEVKAISNAFYGQAIDTKQVARDLSGKAKKDATDVVTPKYPQVTGVQVESSPALAPNIPFFANRITVEIKVNTD